MFHHEAPVSSSEEPPMACPFHHAGQESSQEKERQAANPRREGLVLRPVPGPKPVPILGWRGNILRYLRSPVKYLTALREGWGNVVALAEGGNEPLIYRPAPGLAKQTIFGFGAEINRQVLTHSEVFGGGEFRAPEDAEWINMNMSSVNGERRVQHKAVMAPAFVRENLKCYYEEIAEEIDRMLAGWQGRGEVDLMAEAYTLAGRIASRCFYGQQPDRFEENLAVTIREFATTMFHPMSAIRLKVPGLPYWHLARLSAKIRALLGEELKRKEKQGYSGNDALSMIMRAQFDSQIRLTEDEVMGSSVGLFLAGHDVPANALVLLIALLTTHPDACRRLMEEIDHELGEDLITYDQIFKLPELDRVYKESLRILNPAFLIFRQTQVDTVLGDYEISRGTEVLLTPFMTSRDPLAFDQPGHFKPERWTTAKPSPFEFLPFSYGPRRCLGASFAEIQLKLAITRILQRFRLIPRQDAKLDFRYTFAVHPTGKLVFELKPQDRDFARNTRGIAGDFRRLVESSQA